MFKLPARVNMKGQIRGDADTDGGWTVFTCRDLGHALGLMHDYPRAAMPCWRRIEDRTRARLAEAFEVRS